MSQGQSDYYDQLASEDYYLDGGEPPGVWFGEGAKELGLGGKVQSKTFRDIFEGKLRGKNLVQNPERRCPGWDLTFSAPKSVSVAWSQSDGKTALAIREAQQAAVEKALGYMEEECGITRRGKGGHLIEKAKCVFATFEHGTSRAEQPQLHTHALLLNVAVCEDGKTRAIHSKKFYQHKMTAGAVYRAELAYQLEQKLGVDILRDQFSFKVAGVSDELVDFFSERRKEIEAKQKELGISNAKANASFALTTRSVKTHSASRAELVEEWKKTGESYGWSEPQLHSILGTSTAQTPEITKSLANLSAVEGVQDVMESQSYFTEKDLIRYVAIAAQGRGVSADQAIDAARRHLEHDEIVSLKIEDDKYFTTREHLELEKKLIAEAKALSEGEGLSVSESAIQAAITNSEERGIKLSQEQESAMRHLLQSDGNIAMVTGDAGTGKTTVLKPVAEVLENHGYEVRGLALAGKAAQGLKEGAGIESQTIAGFLLGQESAQKPFNAQKAQEDFEKWVIEKRSELTAQEAKNFNPVWTEKTEERARGRYEEFKQKYTLSEKTVLVIDEAAMVDTRSFAKLVEYTKEAGATLMGIGDGKQLQAITQGGAFIGICDELGSARLSEIYRQRDEAEKEAVRQMADGDVRESLKHFSEEGRLLISEHRDEAINELVNHWGKQGVVFPEENLIMAGRRVDVFELNRRAQELRQEAGFISNDSIEVGNYDLNRGDRVVFKKNDKRIGVTNGSFGTVKGFNTELGTITIEVDGAGDSQERTRSFPLSKYSDLVLGYAATTHTLQGTTVENSYVLTDETMIDREMSYVQISRAQNQTTIFSTVDEVGEQMVELVRSMERSRQKQMAIKIEESALREQAAQIQKQQQTRI